MGKLRGRITLKGTYADELHGAGWAKLSPSGELKNCVSLCMQGVSHIR